MKVPGATSLVVLATVGFWCVCSGLLVGPVRLAHNLRYISYALGASDRNSLLECPYELETTEEVVSKIEWVMLEDEEGEAVGTFVWHAETGESEATGRLNGVVNLERTDGFLELTELRYDLAGYYSCALTLTNDKRKEVVPFQTLIVDTTSNQNMTSCNVSREMCMIECNYTVYTVFPEPSPRLGLFSASLGVYFDEVTKDEWHRQVHPNNSVTYYFTNRQFKVDPDTPNDVSFIVIIPVVKDDGTFIYLSSSVHHSALWEERGCPPLRLGRYQKVNYTDVSTTCRGEYKPHSNEAKAVVTCEEGYHADGSVKSETLTCHSDTLTWEPHAHPHQPKCVMDHQSLGGDGDGTNTLLPSLVLVVFSCLFPRLLAYH